MRRLLRTGLLLLLLTGTLLLCGCSYILLEDPSAVTTVGSPTYALPTPEP